MTGSALTRWTLCCRAKAIYKGRGLGRGMCGHFLGSEAGGFFFGVMLHLFSHFFEIFFYIDFSLIFPPFWKGLGGQHGSQNRFLE